MKLPPKWQTVRIADLGRVVTGNTPSTKVDSYFGGPVLFVTPGDMGNPGLIHSAQRSLSINGARMARLVPMHSTLVVCIGSTMGKIGLAGCELATNQQINTVIPSERVDGRYAFYEIGRVASTIRRLAGTQAVPMITKSDFEDFPATLPPLPEQRKIADILSTWDEALEKLDALIAAKYRRYLGMVEAGVNSPGSPRCKVQDVAVESGARNRGTTINRVLSVTNTQGFVLPEHYFDKTIASENLSNYKIVLRGEFAYNPSRINVGSIARLDRWDSGIVSPIYVVFNLQVEKVNTDFFVHWLQSHEAKSRIRRSAQGSVRDSVNFGDFGGIAFPAPPLARQQAVAQCLNAVQFEMNILRKQRVAFDKQKRGLMQQLLTGKIRVIL
jgi:type I restriction enzyme S subunit